MLGQSNWAKVGKPMAGGSPEKSQGTERQPDGNFQTAPRTPSKQHEKSKEVDAIVNGLVAVYGLLIRRRDEDWSPARNQRYDGGKIYSMISFLCSSRSQS